MLRANFRLRLGQFQRAGPFACRRAAGRFGTLTLIDMANFHIGTRCLRMHVLLFMRMLVLNGGRGHGAERWTFGFVQIQAEAVIFAAIEMRNGNSLADIEGICII